MALSFVLRLACASASNGARVVEFGLPNGDEHSGVEFVEICSIFLIQEDFSGNETFRLSLVHAYLEVGIFLCCELTLNGFYCFCCTRIHGPL